MKELLLLMLMLVFRVMAQAQTPIVYDYDASGNRTHRKVEKYSEDASSNSSMISQVVGKYKVVLGPSPTTGVIEGYVEGYNGSGVTVVVSATSSGSCMEHYTDGKFKVDISRFPDGIFVVHLIITDNGTVYQNDDVKIIKYSKY